MRVVSPATELVVDGVRHVRFDSDDGARGVLPGHEQATAVVERGVVTLRVDDREQFIATEAGVAVLGPSEVYIVTSWAGEAQSMHALGELVRGRRASARALDERRHETAHLHEVAVRRALIEIEREQG